MVNNITPVEQLEERSGYHLMREGVVPTWEGNARGGYWSMMCPKHRTVSAAVAHLSEGFDVCCRCNVMTATGLVPRPTCVAAQKWVW